MNRRFVMCVAALTLLAGVACSSKSGEPSAQDTATEAATTPAASPAGSTTATVVQGTDQRTFDPATITVKAGDTVRWENHGTLPHTVTFAAEVQFDQPLNPDASVEHVFAKPGSYDYTCKFHGSQGMKGKVEVNA